MARALAARIGVQAVLLEHASPQEVIECLKLGACDVAFLPKDARAATRQSLSKVSQEFAGSKVLSDRYEIVGDQRL